MRALAAQPSLVQRVCEAIVSEIVAGRLPSGMRLIQDDVARALGVSRQPVQQALLLLRNQGIVKEASGRGLIVAPLVATEVRDLYQFRTAMEALAARLAATSGAASLKSEGPALIAAGRAALQRGSLEDQIVADINFHVLLAQASGNTLLNETMAPHWAKFRRIMAEVLREGEQGSRRIWDEHAAILDAVLSGDPERSEQMCREHMTKASDIAVGRIAVRERETAQKKEPAFA
ncbi:MAG: GntR family transcriptional regulator [Pseudomonadota bacterium]|nr:GntR family transcriptional regulator [Pseudomonadota bacterium]